MFNFLFMIGLDPSLGKVVSGYHDPFLVFLSVLVASFAAYSSISVVERMEASETITARRLWQWTGALIGGLGIWAMHFTGMLAFVLPFEVSFSVGMTVVSILPAILGCGLTLYFVAKERVGMLDLQAGALSLAVGIGLMHYMGMDAMQMEGVMRYDPLLFIVSILVAYVLAVITLFIRFLLSKYFPGNKYISQTVGAVLMGCTVSAMHYTAMAAASYYVTPETTLFSENSANISTLHVLLAVSIVSAFTIISTLSLIGILVDRRLQASSQSLSKSLERTDDIIANLLDGLVTIDDQGSVLSCNPASEVIFDLSQEEALGESIHDILSSDSLADGFEVGVFSAEGIRPDQTRVPVEISISYLKGATQEEDVYTIFMRDLSTRLEMESKLRQAQKLESIGQLAAGVAHEINTPIQFVSDNTIFLQRAFGGLMDAVRAAVRLSGVNEAESLSEEEIKEAKTTLKRAKLDFVEKQVPRAIEQSLEGLERVARIVSAMKEFSHPSLGVKEPVDLAQAIDMTITVARNEWKYVASVEKNFAEDLPPVPCLRDEFNQVVLNIIVNAAHAIASKYAGEKEVTGVIKISTALEGDDAVIRIEDNGGGIPEHIATKIFDPFFTTKEVGKGTGQGLAIARNVIVDKHGGTIDVESEPGVGTTFIIRLPGREVVMPLVTDVAA